MLKPHNAPLTPEDEKVIADAIADFDDPYLRDDLERTLRRSLQATANKNARLRVTYREAVEEARANGYADPERFAAARAVNEMLGEQWDQRVSAIFKRAQKSVRITADRTAGKYEKASKSAQPHTRRFPERDRRYLAIVGLAEKEGHFSKVGLVVSKIKSALGAYRLPHWEKTTLSLKVMAMSVVSAERGARTINLRLSSDVCTAALASPRGPGSFVQNRIRASLKREFGNGMPEFWFVLERDNDHRFHVHGAVVCGPGQEGVIDRQLMAAGGEWTPSGAHRFQQVGRPLTEPLWWASYAVKHVNVTATGIDRKLFASSAEIRDAARGRWEHLRATLPQA